MNILCTIPFLLSLPAFAQTVGGSSETLHQWNGVAAYDTFSTVSDAGDVNGDGYSDVIVGATGTDPGGLSGAGSAYVYSGVDGSLLYQWDGAAASDAVGDSVSGAGDINGDGFADLIVGAFGADPGGLLGAGSAYVYSGADGSLLYQWDGEAEYDAFGYVSDAGDVNSDGFADVIVGASGASPGGLSNAGSAYLYSGADGVLLHQWNGGMSTGYFLGGSVSGAEDVNGDGIDDVIVSMLRKHHFGSGWHTAANVYSGADGSLIHQWDAEPGAGTLSILVSGAGDVNGDGFADLIVGALGIGPGGMTNAGSVYVYDFHPFLLASTPTISASAGGVLDLTLDFPDTAAFHEYVTLMSVRGTGPIDFGVDIPLTMDSYLIGSTAGTYPFSVNSNLHGTLDASGNAAADITFPAGTYNFAIGRTFWLATVSFPTGLLPEYSSVAAAIKFMP